MIALLYYLTLSGIFLGIWQFFSVPTNQIILENWSDSNLALNQVPFSSWSTWTGKYPKLVNTEPVTDRKQHGYFLHITDMHVDEDYVEGASIKSVCHQLPTTTDTLVSGKYGAPGQRCDSPIKLAKDTLDWISKEWNDKLDFVIWTGDNSKHDWDKKRKRKRKHVYRANQIVTDMMIDTFWSTNKIPVIPSFGNNDVYPHNEIAGPDKDGDLLSFYESMFRSLIPAEQRPIYLEGGYYIVKVAPRLNVLSLNSIYFYTKNTAVHNCLRSDSPGMIQLEWFKHQLKKARMNSERIYVIGHVPPSPRDYKGTCLTEYLHISSNYTDVIMGHFFAHMNMDHFLIFNGEEGIKSSKDLNVTVNSQIFDSYLKRKIEQDDQLFHTTKNIQEYTGWLSDMYTNIDVTDDKKGQPNSHPPLIVIQVSPSVIPVYHPSFRVYQYAIDPDDGIKNYRDDSNDDDDDDDDDDDSKPYGTLLGFAQYFANLTKWNDKAYYQTPLEYELEYTTNKDYGMEDLTVESYFEFAKSMMEDTEEGKKLWATYQHHMLVKTQNL